LDQRIALMRPQIVRLRADIVCFQEVHGQDRPGQPRSLLALRRLLEGTNLDGANVVSSHDDTGGVPNSAKPARRPAASVQSPAGASSRAGRRHPARDT
jgi:hypothetical protein